jgi:hypothetical protein
MRTIYKYPINYGAERFVLEIPQYANLLTIQQQGDFFNPCMWFEVDDSYEKEKIEFILVGTGHERPDDSHKYLGTAMFAGGKLVFHIYTKKTLKDLRFF